MAIMFIGISTLDCVEQNINESRYISVSHHYLLLIDDGNGRRLQVWKVKSMLKSLKPK